MGASGGVRPAGVDIEDRWIARGGAAAIIFLSAIPLLWVALVNGYPLLFADSGTYLRVGTEIYFPPDRPATYGMAIAPFHWLAGPWGVAIAQALFGAFLIGRVMRLMLPAMPALWPLCMTLLLAGTSLPWFEGQIMPDLFTGFVPLVLLLLVLGADRMALAERIVWTILLAGIISFHLTHLALAAALWVILLGMWRLAGKGRRLGVGLSMALGSIALAVVGLSALNLIGAGQFRPSMASDSFLFTRLLDDRVSQPILDDSCAREALLICAIRPTANDPTIAQPGQHYLWALESPRLILLEKDEVRVMREERQIVRRTLIDRPLEVLHLALSGWGRQLMTAQSGDGMIPYDAQMQVHRQIGVHFAGSVEARDRSLQQQGRLLDLAILPDLPIALVASLLVLACAVLNRDWNFTALAVLVSGTIIVNAAVCGILSGVFDRYQSRVIWLLPFAAAIGVTLYLKRRFGGPASGP